MFLGFQKLLSILCLIVVHVHLQYKIIVPFILNLAPAEKEI